MNLTWLFFIMFLIETIFGSLNIPSSLDTKMIFLFFMLKWMCLSKKVLKKVAKKREIWFFFTLLWPKLQLKLGIFSIFFVLRFFFDIEKYYKNFFLWSFSDFSSAAYFSCDLFNVSSYLFYNLLNYRRKT